ncbi:MAG: DUF4864 domain-containing protein [Anaerolineae bacterium]|nr:DUF4864 domain-containing protein [Anaerolineae bacterium]
MKARKFGFSQIRLLLLVLLLSLLSSGCTLNAFEQAEEVETLPTPSPDLAPEEVVRIQLESLRDNDDSNKGIEAAFNFASPGNKKYTGPLSRFVKMLKAPPYNSMLNYKSAEFDPVKITGNSAIQRVKLVGADGQSIIYIFMLSKQTEAPYQNCWMTDGVMVEPTRELPKGQA